MAAAAEETLCQETSEPRERATRRRRTHKGRFIRQGYNRSEREDARREAARVFLSGITLDGHLRQRTETPTQRALAAATPSATPLKDERLEGSPLSEALLSSGVKRDLQFQFETYSPQSTGPVESLLAVLQAATTGSDHYRAQQRNMSRFDSPRLNRNKRLQHSIRGTVDTHLPPRSAWALHKYAVDPENKRIAFTYQGYPLSLSSVLPYERQDRKGRPEEGRTRTNSISATFDLEGSEDLGDPQREVSLARLLDPIWVTVDSLPDHLQSSSSRCHSPSPSRKPSIRRTPGKLLHQHSFQGESSSPPPPLPDWGGQQKFPWMFFREDHSPHTVILQYHPECLDNHDYFIGRKAVSLFFQSYQVSVIQYAPASEIKKEVNKKFLEMFPHVRLSQTKLRSIKKEMVRVGLECGMDSAALAHAHVYYEKLTMMGRVSKPTRKIVAGTCLLLAAKFSSDMKKVDISKLIEEITDKMRVSAKELLSYEFHTLVALEFSLLTPVWQLKTHYDRIREMELT